MAGLTSEQNSRIPMQDCKSQRTAVTISGYTISSASWAKNCRIAVINVLKAKLKTSIRDFSVACTPCTCAETIRGSESARGFVRCPHIHVDHPATSRWPATAPVATICCFNRISASREELPAPTNVRTRPG